jgi:hypothetical protein
MEYEKVLACSAHGGDEKRVQNVGGNCSEKNKRRWKNNLKTDLKKIGFEGVDWVHVAKDRDQWRAVVNTVKNHRVS